FEGRTTGTPIMMMARNADMRPQDYDELKRVYRPSHADFTYDKKYGLRDWRGSGRASARETLARVAAGAVSQLLLREAYKIEITSYVEQVGDILASVDRACVTREMVEKNIVRCPDDKAAQEMIALIEQVRNEGDSVGGVIGCVIRNVPVGLGEPVFDKLHADLGKAMLSINAVKGFEIGSGFRGACLRGSENNDAFYRSSSGKISLRSNNAGGVIGGISSGEDISFRVAFKPVSTIGREQETVTVTGEPAKLAAAGRHDPCVLPRAVPIVDAMSALVLIDHILRDSAQNHSVVGSREEEGG
ncbi:MAG: chorismate synthase, partial [Bdellovibrionales bacterium]|nr:chorismate synthase [Bdellovibrionales bacterium]